MRAERYVLDYELFDETDVGFDEETQLWVYPELPWEGNALLVPCAAVPFEEFVASLPAQAPAARRARNPGRHRNDEDIADATAKLLDMFPWLPQDIVQEVLEEVEMVTVPRKKVEGPAKAADANDDDLGVHDLVAKAMDHLAGLRLAYAEENDEDEAAPIHFYTRIAGGRWTAAHRGVVADSSIAYARRHALDWCRRYSWPRQKGYAFYTYGARNAVELSKEWARMG